MQIPAPLSRVLDSRGITGVSPEALAHASSSALVCAQAAAAAQLFGNAAFCFF